ncbi:MAG: hypothetical protein AAGC44_09570 [Planctomycetota bacterium]
MLSIQTIDRTLEAGDHDRLLRDLGRNGLVLPLPLRSQLAQNRAGAVALGLRRIIELTYRPTFLTRQLLGELLSDQAPDGSWLDAEDQPSAVITAAAVAALGRCLRDHQGLHNEQSLAIQGAYKQGLSALSLLQRSDASFAGSWDRTREDRLLTTSFIAYLLVDDPDFASSCRGHELLSLLENELDRAERTTAELIEMARLARLVPAPAIFDRPGQAGHKTVATTALSC